MRKPKNFTSNISELKSFTSYLNEMIEDGSFYRLSFRERYRHIRRVKRLYDELRGPVTDVSLQRLLQTAAVASFLIGCSVEPMQVPEGNMVVQLALPGEVPKLESLQLTVTGPDMDTFERSYSGGVTDIGEFIPAGNDRHFQLTAVPDPAERIGVMRYVGETTADLPQGEVKDISISMEPDPIEPQFAAAVTNPFGLPGTISTDYATPALGDLDGDGDLDLMVGSNFDGSVGGFRYFENTGSLVSPRFAAESQNPYGLSPPNYAMAPRFVDIDSDGDLDTLAGTPTGDFYHFENTGTKGSPIFTEHQSNPNPFGLSTLLDFAGLSFGDLDRDGDMDLLFGVHTGGTIDGFYYLENTGAQNSPFFSEDSNNPNPFGLSLPNYTEIAPHLVDLDGDGDLDILVGGDDTLAGGPNEFRYFENVGTSASPSFSAHSDNPDPFGLSPLDIDGTQPVVAAGDMDGDGDTDLLVGEYDSAGANLYYFENLAID